MPVAGSLVNSRPDAASRDLRLPQKPAALAARWRHLLRDLEVGRWSVGAVARVVRDESELLEKATYILHNPWKRWPELEEYLWVGARE